MVNIENYSEPKYTIKENQGIIIGKTDSMLELFLYLNHLASLPTTVLIRGDTGTGKELCAKALHYNGSIDRSKNRFVAVNCAGIPSELLESELFGYVKGSFTGAVKDNVGKFQYANGGTIFLDEIGDMGSHLQAKILRVLQDKKVMRVGSNQIEDVDVRIIAASNRNLEEEIKKGTFRQDLYYRLNVVPINVSSLSSRREDIPLIAQYLVERYNGVYGARIEGLNPSANDRLMEHEWKGNVRELENIIERLFIIKREGVISSDDLFFNSDMPRGILTQRITVLQKSEPKEKIEVETIKPEVGEIYLTVDEITKNTNISGMALYYAIKKGRLPFKKDESHITISLSHLLDYAKSSRMISETKKSKVRELVNFRLREQGVRLELKLEGHITSKEIKDEKLKEDTYELPTPRKDVSYSVREASKSCGIPDPTLYIAIKEGRLKSQKVEDVWKIFEGDLIQYVHNSRMPKDKKRDIMEKIGKAKLSIPLIEKGRKLKILTSLPQTEQETFSLTEAIRYITLTYKLGNQRARNVLVQAPSLKEKNQILYRREDLDDILTKRTK
mgnify:CR=1 FL=1